MKSPNKDTVIRVAIDRVTALLNNALEGLESEREALFEELKNSAGDKYETQREMLQQDIKRTEAQKEEHQNQLDLLENLPSFSGVIGLGAVVHLKNESDLLILFIGAAIGDLLVEGNKVKTISHVSPLGQALIGRKTGESVSFNNKSFEIVDCY